MVAAAGAPPIVSSLSRTAALAAVVAALLALLVLAALHIVRPDLDPSWHMISEYAVGANGWLMAVCFAAFAGASASLSVALLAHVQGIAGRIGLVLLLAAAVGLGMAAMFPMDPITTAPADASPSGEMHGVSAIIGMPSMVLSVIVLTFLIPRRALWASAKPSILVLGNLVWIAEVLMSVLMGFLLMQGLEGPGGLVGWANRLLMVSFGLWLLAVAWPIARSVRS